MDDFSFYSIIGLIAAVALCVIVGFFILKFEA
jgi:hypothetical protein